MKVQVRNTVKFISIVFTALALRTAVVFVDGEDPIAGVHPYREIVAACKIFPFALGILSIAYASLLAVYLIFRKYWVGKSVQQGLVFGSLFGLVWVAGMLEGSIGSQSL